MASSKNKKSAKSTARTNKQAVTEKEPVDELVKEELDPSNKDFEDIPHPTPNHPTSKLQKMKDLLLKKKVVSVVAILAVATALFQFVPTVRYAALNLVNEADITVVIVDSETKKPVKDALVKLTSGQEALTNSDGEVFFNDVKYGPQKATATKEAYTSIDFELTVEEDDDRLGDFEIVSTGIPVEVTAKNWLTDEPIEVFTVTSEDGSSVFESVEGIATLNIPNTDEKSLKFTLSAEGYNQATTEVKLIDGSKKLEEIKPVKAEMVVAGKHQYASDRSGTLTFFRSDYDGSNEEKLVDTKIDTSYINMQQFPHDENMYAITFSSDKTFRHDSIGIVNLAEKSFTVVDDAIGKKASFDIQTLDDGWVVYEVNYENGKINDKTKAFVLSAGSLLTLYESPYYYRTMYSDDHDMLIIAENRTAYYYTSYKTSKYELSRIKLPSGEKEQLLTKVDVGLQYIDGDEFYYYLSNTSLTKPRVKEAYYKASVNGTFVNTYVGVKYPEQKNQTEIPDSEKGIASPSEKHRVWSEVRDSRGRLVLDSSDNLVPLTEPPFSSNFVVRWVDDRLVIVYGSSSQDGTADYIVDTKTGEYEKIVAPFKFSYGNYGRGI